MKDDVIFLLRSKLRVEILRNLKGTLTPVMLAKLLNRPRPSVSRSLRELDEKKLVKCLNPHADRWRMYELTKKGKSVLKEAGKFM